MSDPSDEDLLHLSARMPWITVKQCALYLSKSERAIRGLLRRGIIPTQRLGKTIYIDRLVLDEQIRNTGGTRRRRRARN